MNEEWCDWHVLIVEGSVDDGDREVTVLHPDCGLTFTTGQGIDWHCQIQWEMDNAGFDMLLNDHHEPGWYRARMRHYTIRGVDWSEVDCDYEVEPLRFGNGDNE